MAKGRKPKSTEEHKDQGTYREDRHKNRLIISEPLTENPLEFLSEEEKVIWTKWYPVLQKYDVLKETDEVAFGMLCRKFRRIQVLQSQLDSEGFIIEHISDVGAKVIKKNPVYEILRAEEQDVLRLLTEMGMTPASRGKVKTAIKEDLDPFEAAMKSA